MENARPRKSSVFQKTSLLIQMAAVLSVLLVLLLSGFYLAFSRYVIGNYRENSINFNGSYLETVQLEAEDRIGKMSEEMLRFFETPDVNHYVVAGKTYEHTELITASLALGKWVETESLVLDAALLVPDSGIIIQNDQSVRSLYAYGDMGRFPELTAKGRAKGLQLAAIQNRRLRLCVGYPQEMPVAFLSVTLDQEALYNYFAQNNVYPGAWPLGIYDGNREEIFPEQIEYPEFASENLILEKDTGLFRCYHPEGAPRSLVMQLYSPQLDWFFISCTPADRIQPPGFSVLKTVFPFLMFLLAAIALLSVVLVFQIYTPIHRLVHTVEARLSHGRSPAAGRGNELEYIMDAVETESREREQLQKLVQVTEEEIAEKLIGMVAEKGGEAAGEWMQILEGMKHPFTGSGNYILLLYRCQSLTGNQEGQAAEALHLFEARTQVAGFWIGRCDFEPFSVDENTRGAVLRYPENQRPSRINQDLALFETSMRQRPPEGWRLAWGWGEIVKSLARVADTREEAERALERCLYYAGNPELGGKEESEVLERFSRQYSICLDHLTAGLPEGMEELETLKNGARELSREEQKDLCRVLHNILLERLIGLQAEEELLEQLRKFGISGEEEMPGKLEELLDFTHRALKDSGRREQYRYVAWAKEYIQANYADSMLTLDQVSAHLGITSPYLSTLMSRALHMGFGEYLNRYRLEQAKRLLERSDISVQEIGRKTGFNSPQSFGRVFKKYTEETPGKYRERSRKEREEA